MQFKIGDKVRYLKSIAFESIVFSVVGTDDDGDPMICSTDGSVCHGEYEANLELVGPSDISLILSAVNAALGASHTSAYEAVQALVAERERMQSLAVNADDWKHSTECIGKFGEDIDCEAFCICGLRDYRAALKGGGK